MKFNIQLFLLLILFVIVLTSCEKESALPEPENTEINLQAQSGHILPDLQCGTPRTGYLTGNNGVILATAEILNSETNMYVLLTMNTGYFLESVSANFGVSADIPENNNIIVLEDFMFQDFLQEGASTYTVIYPSNSLPVCNDICLHANISQRNMFGQTISTQQSWLGTNPIHNGYFYKYCQSICN